MGEALVWKVGAYSEGFGCERGEKLVFVREADGVKLVAMKPGRKPGDALVARLRGTGNRQRTADQILALTRGRGQRRMILVDANICIDVIQDDPTWGAWSAKELARARNRDEVAINPIIAAEVSLAFESPEDLDRYLGASLVQRLALPYAAAFAAGRAFMRYRQSGRGSAPRILGWMENSDHIPRLGAEKRQQWPRVGRVGGQRVASRNWYFSNRPSPNRA